MAPTDSSQSRRRRHSKYIHVDENAGLEPNMPGKVSGYVENIISAGLAKGARPTGVTREKLLENARALVYALETPREALARYSWAEVCLLLFLFFLGLSLIFMLNRAPRMLLFRSLAIVVCLRICPMMTRLRPRFTSLKRAMRIHPCLVSLSSFILLL